MIRAVIFDFDGTLAPLSLNFDHMRVEIEAIAGRYVNPDEIERLRPLYTLELIYTIEARLNEKGARFRSEAFEKLCALEVQALEGNSPYPYTRDVLATLRGRGMRLGVITRNCLKAVETVFPDIARCVDTIVTRDDTDLVKPNPAHVEIVLSRLGAQPDEAILVGDHPTDIIAGRAARMRTAGVLAGRTQKDKFTEAGADHIVADIRAVIDLLGER
ncbi:MAG: HAD family hydrolase [Syntrophales bacterium]